MEVFLAILMLLLSFFFSGIEIAFLSASRLKIELRTVQGHRSAAILSDFKKKVSEVLITILIGNNLALVVFTIMMERLLAPRLGLDPETQYGLYTFVQTLITTLIVLVLAEYIPKAIFRGNSDYLVFPSAYLLKAFYVILYLPVWIVNVVSKLLLRLFFRLTTEDRIVELGKKDLDQYIQEVIAASEQAPVPDLDTEMLTNALAFRETKARECMIPRTEIVALPIDASVDELMDLFIETHLSKIIIYADSLDQIKGFVHSSSMFRGPDQLRSLIQPVLVVPETMPANMLLAELTENQRSVAIVVDEFGGTAGMVTMEDLVEEVFGEIEDEYDAGEQGEEEEDSIIELQEDGSYHLGGRLEIDDLNEQLGLNLPEDESYTTLAGLIMYVAEDIPNQGESVEVGDYLITVMKAEHHRVICARLQAKPS
ncbi:MAG: HlyC/CorC family transporter [Bacteroidetes bacterium]|nr:MAG: HlyC/CorC family transporter [Bacteroidota bacterium]